MQAIKLSLSKVDVVHIGLHIHISQALCACNMEKLEWAWVQGYSVLYPAICLPADLLLEVSC